jgi:hypothetical protein
MSLCLWFSGKTRHAKKEQLYNPVRVSERVQPGVPNDLTVERESAAQQELE